MLQCPDKGCTLGQFGTPPASRKCMGEKPQCVSVSVLMKRAGVISFFTRRVLQRWQRGEIDTDTAVELLRSDDTVRLVRVWSAAPE